MDCKCKSIVSHGDKVTIFRNQKVPLLAPPYYALPTIRIFVIKLLHQMIGHGSVIVFVFSDCSSCPVLDIFLEFWLLFEFKEITVINETEFQFAFLYRWSHDSITKIKFEV